MEIALRPAKVEDTEAIARWSADKAALAQWAGPEVDFPLTREQMAAWLAEKNSARPRHCFTAVEGQDAPAGYFQLSHDAGNETVRIARFVVTPAKRGAGFGTKVFARAVALAFGDFGAHRVELGVMSTNQVARRLYERAGFVQEGTARDAMVVEGRRFSVMTMSCLRPERADLAKPEVAA